MGCGQVHKSMPGGVAGQQAAARQPVPGEAILGAARARFSMVDQTLARDQDQGYAGGRSTMACRVLPYVPTVVTVSPQGAP
jgi:hypothetical protein